MYSINQVRQYWANKTINYSLLVLVTLVTLVATSAYLKLTQYDVPLILGVIAAALAIDDDSFVGRLKVTSIYCIKNERLDMKN